MRARIHLARKRSIGPLCAKDANSAPSFISIACLTFAERRLQGGGLHTLRCLTLTGINSEHRPVARLADRMDSFVFKCPCTGMNVQHRFADEPAPDGPHCTYQTVLCQACSRLHFINRSSRRLLGEPEE